MSFAQTVAEWQPFYMAIVAAAATLLGLLFVAVSLNIDLFNREDNIHLKSLSRQTFINFVFIIAFALVFLIPEQTPVGLGLPLTVIGCFGLVTVFRDVRGLLRTESRQNLLKVLRRLGWRLLAFLTMLIFAIRIMQNSDVSGLYYMIWAMFFLLISATWNSWILLVGMGDQPKHV